MRYDKGNQMILRCNKGLHKGDTNVRFLVYLTLTSCHINHFIL